MSVPLRFDAVRDGDLVVARIAGEVDLSNVTELGRRLDAAIDGAPAVVVDVSAVEYLDSQGIRLLHGLAQRLAGAGVDLAFVAPARSVAGRVLALTRLHDVAPVRESLDA
jgi:anti-anti-sigma factor